MLLLLPVGRNCYTVPDSTDGRIARWCWTHTGVLVMTFKCVWMVIGVRVSLRGTLRDSCVVDLGGNNSFKTDESLKENSDS